MKTILKIFMCTALIAVAISACTVSSTSKVNVNINEKNIIDAKAGFDTSDPNSFDYDLNTSDYKK